MFLISWLRELMGRLLSRGSLGDGDCNLTFGDCNLGDYNFADGEESLGDL